MVVAKVAEINEGEKKEVQVNGKAILLIKSGGNYFAIDARCPHKKLPLSKGKVDGTFITCAFHGSKFNITDGSIVNGPATEPVATYPVKVEGDSIDIDA
jgi:3-phenylpropionate/trans-cinnamate dioxygenase ferredoxin subunit